MYRKLKAFQGESVDPTKLLSNLTFLITATSRRIMITTAKNRLLAQTHKHIIGYESGKLLVQI